MSPLQLDRERVKDDLRGLVKGDVLSDEVTLRLYSTDASIYEIKPLVVVRPRSLDDVKACVQYAAENSVPIHARGAGTGLAGESLGEGLVLDFSRYMRHILRVDDDSVCVQPGVVHAQLNEFLRPRGRHFGPDPVMSSVTTMGSVVAVDSGGSHWLKYGSARRHVRRLQIVLADGATAEAGQEPTRPAEDAPPSRVARLASEAAGIVERNQDVIRSWQPRSVVNRLGYQLGDVLGGGRIDLAKLLSGSEGTLALFTELTLATSPLPRHRCVGLLFFDRLENAARAVLDILPYEPSACDLMDRRHLSLARDHMVQYDLLIPPQAEGALLVECEGDAWSEVRQRFAQIVDRVRRKRRWAFHAVQAQDRAEVELFWRLSRKVIPTLFRIKGSTRPLPFVEDLAVPPAALPDFLVRMQNVLKQHQVTASLFGHAGHGQLHLRPFLDLRKAEDVARMAPLAADLYRETLDVGGTISGEHAAGLSRTSFLRQQYGPLVDVFWQIKRAFDPANIFNPHKILSDRDDLLTSDLRRGRGMIASRAADSPSDGSGGRSPAAGSPPPVVELQLAWSLDEVTGVSHDCNGCGACRSQSEEARMCPIFRFRPREEASPRAKANLMRGLLTGRLDPSIQVDDLFKSTCDLCVNCHMCRVECPAGVDIPRLMIESKAAYVRTNGLSTAEWAAAHVDQLSALASSLASAANWALGNRAARWLLAKTLGFAQQRRLPRLAARSFFRLAARRRLTRPTRRSGLKIVYFVDTYANYYDPQLAESLVAVMEHNGVAVYVHPDQLSSAMPMIAQGALGPARKVAQRNVALLAEAVRMGYQIVATEPSAALCLTHEYLALLNDDDARLVAENSSEACNFLWKLHQAGKLQLDLRPVPVTLGYHQPCHLKVLQNGAPGESLLRLVPGLVLHHIESGCSGMAGTFGLMKENFRASVRAGRGMLKRLRDPRLQAGTTECSACKLQMEQGSGKTTIHPLKILALSYGLMPELAQLLSTRN